VCGLSAPMEDPTFGIWGRGKIHVCGAARWVSWGGGGRWVAGSVGMIVDGSADQQVVIGHRPGLRDRMVLSARHHLAVHGLVCS